MIGVIVRRMDLRHPRLFTDNFNRPNSADLGSTPVGRAEWQQLRGNWSIRDNRLWVSTSTANPLVGIETRAANDFDAELAISSSSGDGLALRIGDAQNYLRVGYFYNRVSTTQFCDEREYICITAPVRPLGASVAHTHDRRCWSRTGNCCDRGATWGTMHGHQTATGFVSHGDELALPGQWRSVPCGSSTTTTRRIYLDRVQQGTVTTLNWWTVPNPFLLGVNVRGNVITIRRGGWAGQVVGSHTTSFNAGASMHGVARRAGGRQGTAMDNFRLNAETATLI